MVRLLSSVLAALVLGAAAASPAHAAAARSTDAPPAASARAQVAPPVASAAPAAHVVSAAHEHAVPRPFVAPGGAERPCSGTSGIPGTSAPALDAIGHLHRGALARPVHCDERVPGWHDALADDEPLPRPALLAREAGCRRPAPAGAADRGAPLIAPRRLERPPGA